MVIGFEKSLSPLTSHGRNCYIMLCLGFVSVGKYQLLNLEMFIDQFSSNLL